MKWQKSIKRNKYQYFHLLQKITLQNWCIFLFSSFDPAYILFIKWNHVLYLGIFQPSSIGIHFPSFLLTASVSMVRWWRYLTALLLVLSCHLAFLCFEGDCFYFIFIVIKKQKERPEEPSGGSNWGDRAATQRAQKITQGQLGGGQERPSLQSQRKYGPTDTLMWIPESRTKRQ